MSLTITIATDETSWFVPAAHDLAEDWRRDGHLVNVVHRPDDIEIGNLAFLLSLGQLLPPDVLSRNEHNLVVHASSLPEGKGWSPVTWQVIEGKLTIPLTLFEAVEAVDAGTIYLQSHIHLDGTELVDEIREKQAQETNALCREFVSGYPDVLAAGREQAGAESFYRRRGPADSELDAHQSLAEQFDLLRSCDPESYPAYFTFRGATYELRLTKRSGL